MMTLLGMLTATDEIINDPYADGVFVGLLVGIGLTFLIFMTYMNTDSDWKEFRKWKRDNNYD
jgi:hypothetical protein